jgi:hypothetical protein
MRLINSAALALGFLVSSTVTASTLNLPPGVVEVYSAYTDLTTHKVKIIRGYGIIIKLTFHEPGGTKSIRLIQTVSHLSQGGLKESGVPRVGVRLQLANGQQVMAHYSEYKLSEELRPALQGATPEPLLFSSYFANSKDSEILIVDPSHPLANQLVDFAEIVLQDGRALSLETKLDLKHLPSGWRLKQIRPGLTILCPVTFPHCAGDDQPVRASGTKSYMATRIGEGGFIQTEYDWLFFTRVDRGMSGLPILLNKSLFSMISSSSAVTAETWGLFLMPVDMFQKWAQSRFKSQNLEGYKVFSETYCYWELDNGAIRRRLTGEHHEYLEWSPARDENGNAFRFDNGDGVAGSDFGRGGFQVVNSNGKFSKSSLLVMSHPKYTRIVPPTVAGMALSHYVKEFDYNRIAQGLYGGLSYIEYKDDERQVEWSHFKELFTRFYRAISLSAADKGWLAAHNPYHSRFNDLQVQKFTSELSVTTLETETKGHLTLYNYVNHSGKFIGVFFVLEIQGEKISHWVSFSHVDGVGGAFAPFIPVLFKGQTAQLELSGMLTHNPDRINIPDLTGRGATRPIRPEEIPPGLDKKVDQWMDLEPFDGEIMLKTVFSLTLPGATYYLSVPASGE